MHFFLIIYFSQQKNVSVFTSANELINIFFQKKKIPLKICRVLKDCLLSLKPPRLAGNLFSVILMLFNLTSSSRGLLMTSFIPFVPMAFALLFAIEFFGSQPLLCQGFVEHIQLLRLNVLT